MTKKPCSWCEGREDEDNLCHPHAAESMGITVSEMYREIGERASELT